MQTLKYKFDDCVNIKNSSYIFQFISERKLSNIYHSHDFYEIIILLGGNVIHRLNGTEIAMKEGDCIILTPKDAHSFVMQSEDTRLVGLSVRSDEIFRFVNCFPIELCSACEEQIFSCSARLNELKNQSKLCMDAEDDCENKLLLCTILRLYKMSKKNVHSNIPAVIATAVNAMSYDENLKGGVEALVNLTNYSYPHLYRLIKQYYGVTPHELVFKLKLDAAYRKLTHSDISVERVAESVGFASVSHFNCVFKKTFGISPAKLRGEYSKFYFKNVNGNN